MNEVTTMAPEELVLGSARLRGLAADGGLPATGAAWRQAIEAHGLAATAAAADGPFAVGLRLDDGRVVLAVDRFAQETICYRVCGGELRFAARADALADSGTPLQPQALFEYLYLHAIASPRTAFAGVFRLPPGHCAVFNQGRLEVSSYWTPTFEPQGRPDFDALRSEFRELLRQAVGRHLGHGPAACFLSGGTDSSTVAGVIAELGEPPTTYSIGFEAEGYDEMAYARIAARHFKTRHREHYVTPDELVRLIPEAAAWFDQPFGNSSVLPAFSCSRTAQADGVTQLLAGDGGDELFGGNSRYALLRVFGWYAHVPSALRRGALEPFFGAGPVRRTPILRKGSGYIEQASTPMPDRLQAHNLLLRLGINEVLTPAFLARVDTAAPLAQQREVWSVAVADDDLDRTLAYDWRYTLAESDLPKVRSAAQMAGIGVAFPFLDRALLDFSLRLPTSYKLNRLKLRWFFKEALRGFLPDEILVKKKHGFGLPFGVWAIRHAGLRGLASESLKSLAGRNLVRADFIERLLAVHLPAHPGYYGEMVWILMMLEQWLQRKAADFRLD
jgi:asparagine synthase (glutamine-hydrolysing)